MRKLLLYLIFLLTIIYLRSGNSIWGTKILAGVLQPIEKQNNPTSAFDDTTLAEPDSGADTVATFYKILCDEKDLQPGIDSKLFDSPELWRRVFIERKILKSDETLMTWCRAHKELFVPKHMRSLADVQISSTFYLNRNVEIRKGRPRLGQGLVLVIYLDRVQDGDWHNLIFHFENGKIDPQDIWLHGFSGKGEVAFEKSGN